MEIPRACQRIEVSSPTFVTRCSADACSTKDERNASELTPAVDSAPLSSEYAFCPFSASLTAEPTSPPRRRNAIPTTASTFAPISSAWLMPVAAIAYLFAVTSPRFCVPSRSAKPLAASLVPLTAFFESAERVHFTPPAIYLVSASFFIMA